MGKKKTMVLIEGQHEFDIHVKKKKDVTKYKLHRSNNPVWTEPKELLLKATVDDINITIGDVVYDASSFDELYTMMQAIVKDQKKLLAKRKYIK